MDLIGRIGRPEKPLKNMEEETVVAPTLEEQVIEETPETEEVEEENVELTKAQQIAENQRIRAEKAEKELKKLKEKNGESPKENPSLSTADIIALSKVHEDDVERVERYAKSEGLSVREALKNPELKAILDMREEQRATANASNVSNVRRGSTKIADDVLISNASNGKIPESEDDIARLIQAKMKQKD